MAELGKEKKSGSGDGGGQVGFRFNPGEAEVVEYYLLPRLQGRPPVPNDAIVMENVYKCEPQMLINEAFKGKGDEEAWYFLSPRDRKYRNGSRPSRCTADSAGRWKASTGKAEAKETVCYGGEANETVCYGGVKFCVTSLVYFKGPVKDEVKTKWLMREFTIPQFENKLDKSGDADDSSSSNKLLLDQYVLCRIYKSPKKGVDDEEEDVGGCDADADEWVEACAIFNLDPETAETSGGQGAAADDMRSRKQAGKRPVEAAVQPPKRPCMPPPPSPAHGACGGQPPMPPRPPQAMANHQIPMQQLSLMHSFPPAAAHTGYRQPPPMCHGHALVQRLPMHGQPPPLCNIQPQSVQRRPIHRGQAPVHNNYQALPLPLPVHGGQVLMHEMRWLPGHNAQPPVQQLQLPFHDWMLADNLQLPMEHLPVMMNNYQLQAPIKLPPMISNEAAAGDDARRRDDEQLPSASANAVAADDEQ
ncbi:hypothetical protein E2562_015624 [Oryza meyeriana var. granulata]|uniref:NAC domain-containing protein n=1 Tax=Oryza meyeriana var. granulata TaxID=110450 RepID=A0A6G1ELB0_9ORYZ|nr:hypothetical protein E2562_015624 [Oryza meyeriana var. granulata]